MVGLAKQAKLDLLLVIAFGAGVAEVLVGMATALAALPSTPVMAAREEPQPAEPMGRSRAAVAAGLEPAQLLALAQRVKS
jgi:hypothetical protein